MRGFKNPQGTFFHCTEIGERNWVLRLVGSGDIGFATRNFTKNPSQRLDTGAIPTPWWFTPECEQQLLSIGEDGKIPSHIKPEASTPDSTIAELSEEQLRTRLKLQLEYYFSRENLNQDRYLRSQMDNDQYVPIQTVASFPKISHLTSDQELIISVLKESLNVQVDETNTKVRAAHRRCTLLLREIPEFTDEREVKAMFIGCPPYTSLKYGLNNSWYVTFETEEATQLAFLHLQNLRKSFNGKQICVRIKTGSAPLSDPSGTADYGRHSPAKSEIFIGNKYGISTVATSNGYITGFPASILLNSANSNSIRHETEFSLDQLMGPFGYSIRAIFQPKDSEPPRHEQENQVPSEDNKKSSSKESPSTRTTILGPPSTEIVESMLSAAAEANETKRREKEVQKQQWQQIMDNLAPMPSIMGGQRITDMPFIKKAPPALHRYISQESADIEVALDIQRAARKQEKEAAAAAAAAKLQQEQQEQQQQQQRAQQQAAQIHQHQQQHGYNDGYRQSSKSYSDRNSGKDYNNHYNGYSSGERSTTTYDRNYEKRSTPSYRGGKSYDSRSDKSGKSSENYNSTSYKPRERNYNTSNNYYHDRSSNNNNNYNNSSQRYDNNYGSNSSSKPALRYPPERKPQPPPPPPPPSQKSYPSQSSSSNIPQTSQTTTTSYASTTAMPAVKPPPQPSSTAPPKSPSNPEKTLPPPPTTPSKSVEIKQSNSPIPIVIVPSSSSTTTTTPTTPTTTIHHSDAASTTSSSRKKDNSESSEYNFVDGDFPSLVEKQKQAQVKEKAKFSAVVAGKKNDVKKSYAQTLKKQESKSNPDAK